ncbi:hypothetical protein FAZ69_32330 [Trinickia terrae]|uniref:Uncharacterized protein n=1 Tax=Trinickia terrae TaxID=2571161 RepID=A0A4U1HHD5_9BURK|nr:hypothetical protein [Trinickia terrae]TKC77966.1 hypothetical protein FAZ69_32330 [Trinickia terrae]
MRFSQLPSQAMPALATMAQTAGHFMPGMAGAALNIGGSLLGAASGAAGTLGSAGDAAQSLGQMASDNAISLATQSAMMKMNNQMTLEAAKLKNDQTRVQTEAEMMTKGMEESKKILTGG